MPELRRDRSRVPLVCRGRRRSACQRPPSASFVGSLKQVALDLTDYLRTLQRQWPVLLASVAACVVLASVYLLLTPKQYVSTATVLISANDPSTRSDAAQSLQFATSIAGTVADVAQSDAVLEPAVRTGPAGLSLDTYQGSIAVSARDSRAVIDITAAQDDGPRAADMANAVARTAVQLMPGLTSGTVSASPIRLRMIQAATPPDTPVSPDTRGVILVALILGALIGLAAAIARQALDTRVRRPEDLRRIAGASLLAAVPRLSRVQRRLMVRGEVLIRTDAEGAVGDAFRSLRTNVANSDLDSGRTILVAPVSSDRLEPFVAVNLAWSIMRSGRSVLIVDLDLRHPSVHAAVGGRLSPGLSEALNGLVETSQVVQQTHEGRLDFIAAGSPAASPSDLLSTPLLAHVLKDLGSRYEYVVVNAPPVRASTDAAVVARYSALTILTVASGADRYQHLEEALSTLRNARLEHIGLVVTGVVNARSTNRRLRARRQESLTAE